MFSRVLTVLISAAAGIISCNAICNQMEHSAAHAKGYVMDQPMFEVIAQYNQCDVIKFTQQGEVNYFLDCEDKYHNH